LISLLSFFESRLKISEALANDWLQHKNYAAGQSGTGSTADIEDDSNYVRK
jgi:hypothetical protein